MEDSGIKKRKRARKAQKGHSVLFVVFFAFFVVTPSSFFATNFQVNNTQIEAGRRLFAGSCSNNYCHGSEGSGGGGPKLKGHEFTAERLTRVITDGIPGTAMPGFKKTYTAEQIAQIVAYVSSLSPNSAQALSENRPPSTDPHIPGARPEAHPGTSPSSTKIESEKPSEKPAVTRNDSSDLRGDASAGRELFFDATQTQNCRVCHTVGGIGGKIGPDLSSIADKPAREILQSIAAPHAVIAEKYATIAITTRDGARFTGVKRDENEKVIRLYDTSTLPPVSRAFLKEEIVKTEKLTTSAMPGDYATKYSLKQLLDLVSFLKSGDPAKAVNVGLKDLF
jgi:putative heme-binding domain-containing protein